jgi:hypothetical protein
MGFVPLSSAQPLPTRNQTVERAALRVVETFPGSGTEGEVVFHVTLGSYVYVEGQWARVYTPPTRPPVHKKAVARSAEIHPFDVIPRFDFDLPAWGSVFVHRVLPWIISFVLAAWGACG